MRVQQMMIALGFKTLLRQTTYYNRPKHLALIAVPEKIIKKLKEEEALNASRNS